MPAIDLLTEDLFGIYAAAGREVTYITDRGERKAYWANRYRQAVQRAVDAGDVVAFVERLVQQDEPSRGFGYLIDAGRLDLTVEALVINEDKPYHDEFSREAIEAARERLADAGFAPAASGSGQPPTKKVSIAGGQLEPGASFDVRVTVATDGSLSLALV
jgi:hypothetical protein